MQHVRIVASRIPQFDPAYFAFERLLPFTAPPIASLFLDLSGDDTAELIAIDSAGFHSLAEFDLPRGDDNTDSSRLAGCSALVEWLSCYLREHGTRSVHAFSFNLAHTLCALSEIAARVVSFRGLDVMKGIALRRIHHAVVYEPLLIHCPSLELMTKCLTFDIASRVVFVPNGAANETRATARERIWQVIIPGHVGVERDILDVLDTLDGVLDPGATVVSAGSRGFLIDDDALHAHALQRRHRYNLLLFGPMAHDELLELIPNAALAICPAGREGGQSSILECIAAGVPVIAGNTETNLQLFGDASWIANPQDIAFAAEVRRILSDDEYAGSVAAQQRRAVRARWTAAHEHERFLTLYRELIASEDEISA